MEYMVRGHNNSGEEIFYEMANHWEDVKIAFRNAVHDGCHPCDITVFEAKKIHFNIDYTLIVEPS